MAAKGASKKDTPRRECPCVVRIVRLTALAGGVALAAIDRTIFSRLEGNLGGLAAFCAHSVVHHARSTAVPRGLVSHTALTAAGRFILKSLLGIEFLLADGEHEFLATVTAHQRLVLIHCF